MNIYLNIEELKKCLEKTRYVEVGDEVRAGDYNMRVECLKKLGDIAMSLNPEDPSIGELKKKLETLEYVRTGDIILPEHHNLVVEALKIAVNIIETKLLKMTGEIIDIKIDKDKIQVDFKVDKDIIKDISLRDKILVDLKIDKDIIINILTPIITSEVQVK